jgi:hypothetical protein
VRGCKAGDPAADDNDATVHAEAGRGSTIDDRGSRFSISLSSTLGGL